MKKLFLLRLTALVTAALLCGLSGCALAEETGCPVNPPPAFGVFPTLHTLYSGQPVDYDVTLFIDEETGLRTYTIGNPADWGILPEACGTWAYEAGEDGAAVGEAAADAGDGPDAGSSSPDAGSSSPDADQPAPVAEPAWIQTEQGGDQVQLLLTDAAYAENGFPRWTVSCAGAADKLTLTAYLGQVRHLYAYVDYYFGEDCVSVTAEDHSFTITCEKGREGGFSTTISSYDSAGVLAYANYIDASDDGSMVGYTVEARPASQTYQLATLSRMDAEGNACHWENGQWMNEKFEPVEAPEGLSPENVPYTVEGGWQGVPFASPGDAPEGSFPAAFLPADPALAAHEYSPWPEDENAIHASLQKAGPTPALPAVTWATREDGAVVYTLTGIDAWGIAPEDQGDWILQEEDWVRGSDSTPGTLRLIGSPISDGSLMIWERETVHPGEFVQFTLDRSYTAIDARLAKADGSSWWFDDQAQGGFSRPLSGNRSLEAFYMEDALESYSILARDEAGNLQSQATYEAAEDGDTFELTLFFLYSPNAVNEYLWRKDIGWYSYDTGAPCEAPDGVDLAAYAPLGME